MSKKLKNPTGLCAPILDNTVFVVTFPSFLQQVERTFATLERAEQWTRQVGKFYVAKITQHHN